MTNTYQFPTRKGGLLILLLFTLLSMRSPVSAQYVHTDGTQILDENGDELYFVGMNLGNWLLWEGYLMMGDFNYRTHTQFFNSVKDAFGGDINKALEFEHQWRLNYVTEQAIVDLKSLGFNSVRVPFNYNMFWDFDNKQPSSGGFFYLDRLVDYCRNQGVYILLDMHAAPGYQNPGDHSDNVNSNASQPRETVTFWDGNNVDVAAQVWRHIANYYKNEPVIWGYDLINEPVPQPGREFELLGSLITMRNAIREVDNNHIIVAEGSWWGSDMQKIDWMDPETQNITGINYRWDNNLVYQTHHYSTDVSLLDGRLAICDKLNVPMILGEYGESDNGNLRNMTDWCIENDVDYFPWSFKKMSHDKCLWTIHPNEPYNQLKNFINSGGTPPASLYDDMIDFCQNNIANGAPGLSWDQGWYDAVKFDDAATPLGCESANAVQVSAVIEAENFCDMNGLQTESSSEGGLNIGYADPGDWADYKIEVSQAGTYTISLRVASGDTGTKQVEAQAGGNSATVNFAPTGDWQSYVTVSTSLYLNAGVQNFRLYFPTSGVNVNWFEISTGAVTPVLTSMTLSPTNVTLELGDSQQFVATGYDQNNNEMSINPSWNGASSFGVFTASSPGTFSVSASQGGVSASATVTVNDVVTGVAVPGQIEAENYADMSGIQTQACSEGGENIGWVNSGDWIEYNINVQSSRTYDVDFRVAANGSAAKSIQMVAGGNTASVNFNATGGWQNWTTASTQIDLAAGQQVLRLNFPVSGLNINWLSFEESTSDPDPDPNPQGFRIEAEDYFEMYGLQTEQTSDTGGGQNVGWIDSGDWAGYAVDIASAGTYTVSYRVASQNGGGQIQLEVFGGGSAYGLINVPSTGGWQSWTTISHTVSLPAGQQNLALAFPSGGFNINWIEISSASGARLRTVDGELDNMAQVSLYPNPATYEITLSNLSANYDLAAVYGIMGERKQIIDIVDRSEVTLDISGYSAGLYFVILSQAGQIKSQMKFKVQ